jgi:hypothetical protein
VLPGPRDAAAACLICALGAFGCGEKSGGTARSNRAPIRSSDAQERRAERPAPIIASHCPADLPTCATAEGRIAYVERVDPDGDGDAHFVILDPPGVTLPGLTAIDVRKGLRPTPLPAPGDMISAAGPVQTGSYGQHQIHAIELHVAGE